MNTRTSPAALRAPVLIAAPLPSEYGCRTTRAPQAWLTDTVASVDPSSTTRISAAGNSAINWASNGGRLAASFLAGRMMLKG